MCAQNWDPADNLSSAGASLAIWTTTPWTIPANAAVAVNANLQYSVVEVQVRHDTQDPMTRGCGTQSACPASCVDYAGHLLHCSTALWGWQSMAAGAEDCQRICHICSILCRSMQHAKWGQCTAAAADVLSRALLQQQAS